MTGERLNLFISIVTNKSSESPSSYDILHETREYIIKIREKSPTDFEKAFLVRYLYDILALKRSS